MIVTELAIKSPEKGDIKGMCTVCGKDTIEGKENPFSGTFTGYSYLTHGNCTCPHCYAFFKNPNFRKKSWIATNQGTNFIKKNECKNFILSPPKPPFFLYITKSHKRQGWLSALKYISYSKDKFYISTDWIGHFLADKNKANIMIKLIEELRRNKIMKKSLTSGVYTMKETRLSIENNYHDLIKKSKEYTKQQLWEVLVYVAE